VLRNPGKDPVLIAAAIALCGADMFAYCSLRLKREAPGLTDLHTLIGDVTKILVGLLYQAATFLERLSDLLIERLGDHWWKNTILDELDLILRVGEVKRGETYGQ
jgi:hypothetical protein